LALEALRPEGDPIADAAVTEDLLKTSYIFPHGGHMAVALLMRDGGREAIRAYLNAVVNPEAATTLRAKEAGAEVRKLLGPVADRIAAHITRQQQPPERSGSEAPG
jgi:hypothetical protein